MSKSGIYKIVNKINGKYYLGSAKHIKNRWKRHRYELRHNKHHSTHLQRAWNKYGESNFAFVIIEECDNVQEREQELLNVLKPWVPEIGYNVSNNTTGGDLLTNNPRRKEIIEKIKKTVNENISQMTDEERKARWSRPMESNPNWKGGKTFFKCPICGKIVRTGIKRKTCGDCRNRNGEDNPFYGKIHSNETKKKLSEAAKKRGNSTNTQKLEVEIDGVIYSSMSVAAKEIGCVVATIRNRIENPKFPNYKLIQP